MRKLIMLVTLAMTASGCTNSVAVQRDAEVFSSLPFDEISCAQLTQQRNSLAARYGLAPDIEREPKKPTSTTGFDLIIPDIRGAPEREKARAIGEITAMNNSLRRRQCGAA